MGDFFGGVVGRQDIVKKLKRIIAKRNKSYKEPVFLFTSSSMRQAAWAGWYSALGNRELRERYIHAAHSEWIKELGAGRRYNFLGRYNDDIWRHIPEEKLKEIINNFFKTIKIELKKLKTSTKKGVND